MKLNAVSERLPRRLLAIAADIAGRGGRLLIVGGWVRDRLLGVPCKDIDAEVHGLSEEELSALLAQHGTLLRFGRSFEVYKLRGLGVEFCLPRAGKEGGTTGASVDALAAAYAEASRWRDLTINAMAVDPLSSELFDAHGGQTDIASRTLRAVDPATFVLDPLRPLRVALFAARLDATVHADLIALCQTVRMTAVAAERIAQELRKLLLEAARPSVGLDLLERMDQLSILPEVKALRGIPQDPGWHPEGDVWIHTRLVVDEAAGLRDGGEHDLALMFGALLHDVGKATCTHRTDDGRIRSSGHETVGAGIAAACMRRLLSSNDLVAQVEALVRHHGTPLAFMSSAARGEVVSDGAYRRLARKLNAARASMDLLARLSLADVRGRGVAQVAVKPGAVVGPEAEAAILGFQERARRLAVGSGVAPDVVMGRHLQSRGLQPGEHMGDLLAACRAYQDETGAADPDEIMDAVLGGATHATPSADPGSAPSGGGPGARE